jgi:hypothetical protein
VADQPSIDFLDFSRQLYAVVAPHTEGRPFIYRDRRGLNGWCCILFDPCEPLAWIRWGFRSWAEAMSWLRVNDMGD